MTATESEMIRVSDDAYSCECNGPSAPFGHPLVYLPFDGRTVVACYYCGCRFAKSSYFERAVASAR